MSNRNRPRPGQDLPERFYENPNPPNEFFRIIMGMFGLDKHMWGIAREGEEYPDLLLKSAPYFGNAEGQNRPAWFRLEEAIQAFFGDNIRVTWKNEKDSERKFKWNDRSDLIWFWHYFKAHYAEWGKINPYLKDLANYIKNHHHDELRKRSPVKARGYTIPGYNFCGPKNSLDFVPTTMLDAICMYHDLVYAHRPHSLEKDDDKEFNIYIDLWQKANIGDGWTGPTVYERQTVIPFIKSIFKMKNAVGSERPWTKALIPSFLRDYVINFKQYITDPHFSDKRQMGLLRHSPLIALENMIDNSFASARKDRLLDKQYIALNEAIEHMDDVKKFWNEQAQKHPEARHLAFKEFTKYEYDNPMERWLPGMLIPQYIASADTFILNFHGYDGKVWPIYFVRDARVPDILWSWSENPSKMMWSDLANAEVPYAVHKSYESRAQVIEGIDWEPIYTAWSTLEDPSRQLVDSPGQRQIYKTYASQEEANEAAKVLIEQEKLKQQIAKEPHLNLTTQTKPIGFIHFSRIFTVPRKRN
jgi:hypothetical protein